MDHLVSRSDNLRLDPAVLRGAVAGERRDGVDVAQLFVGVVSRAVQAGGGQARLSRRGRADGEDVLCGAWCVGVVL